MEEKPITTEDSPSSSDSEVQKLKESPISSATARGPSPIRLRNSVLQLALAFSLLFSVVGLFLCLALFPFPQPLQLILVLLGVVAGVVSIFSVGLSVVLLLANRSYDIFELDIKQDADPARLGTDLVADLTDALVAKAMANSFGRVYRARIRIFPTKLEIQVSGGSTKEIPLHTLKRIEAFSASMRLETEDDAFYVFFGSKMAFLLLRRIESGQMDVFRRYLIDTIRFYAAGKTLKRFQR